jgi:hypothetical protein
MFTEPDGELAAGVLELPLDRLFDESDNLVVGQAAQLDPIDRPPVGPHEVARRRIGVRRAKRGHDQDALAVDPLGDVAEELDGSLVGPGEVVDHEQEWCAAREHAKPVEHCFEQAVAVGDDVLVARCGELRDEAAKLRQETGQFAQTASEQRCAVVHPCENCSQRLDEGREGLSGMLGAPAV